jgi:hypothetical protein
MDTPKRALAPHAEVRLRVGDGVFRDQVFVGALRRVQEERVAAVHGHHHELRQDVPRPQIVEDRRQAPSLPELAGLEEAVQRVDDRVGLRAFRVGRGKVHRAAHVAAEGGGMKRRDAHLRPQRSRHGHDRGHGE